MRSRTPLAGSSLPLLLALCTTLLGDRGSAQERQAAKPPAPHVGKIEIFNGPNRTVRYVGEEGVSPRVMSLYRRLAVAENEMTLVEQLEMLKHEYVSNERKLESARTGRQLASLRGFPFWSGAGVGGGSFGSGGGAIKAQVSGYLGLAATPDYALRVIQNLERAQQDVANAQRGRSGAERIRTPQPDPPAPGDAAPPGGRAARGARGMPAEAAVAAVPVPAPASNAGPPGKSGPLLNSLGWRCPLLVTSDGTSVRDAAELSRAAWAKAQAHLLDEQRRLRESQQARLAAELRHMTARRPSALDGRQPGTIVRTQGAPVVPSFTAASLHPANLARGAYQVPLARPTSVVVRPSALNSAPAQAIEPGPASGLLDRLAWLATGCLSVVTVVCVRRLRATRHTGPVEAAQPKPVRDPGVP